jgi:hypothetical protein
MYLQLIFLILNLIHVNNSEDNKKEYVLCLNNRIKFYSNKDENMNVEFKEFDRQMCNEIILTMPKKRTNSLVNDEYINKANEDTLLTVFKEKHHKSAEAFKFTQKFFIDSKTKKYCYIYNFAL